MNNKLSRFYITIALVLFLQICISSKCWSNNLVCYGNGASVFPINNSNIQMISEIIKIVNVNGTNWDIDSIMTFKNCGPETFIQIGFPFETSSFEDSPPCVLQIKTYVDSQPIEMILEKNLDNLNLPGFYYPLIYVFKVHFDKDETKTIRQIYTVAGTSEFLVRDFSYILRTGALWKDSIKNIDISLSVDQHSLKNCTSISPKEDHAEKDGDNIILTWNFSNLEPKEDIKISYQYRPAALPINEKIDIEEMINIPKEDYCNLAVPDLRYQLNKIYASYGYPFTNPFIYSQFYYEGSPFTLDPKFSINKIPLKVIKYLDFLTMIENWNTSEIDSLNNLVPPERRLQSFFQMQGGLNPIFIDRKRSYFIVLWSNNLVWLDLDTLKYRTHIQLPGNVYQSSRQAFDVSQICQSPDKKYLALNWERKSDERRILLIDLDSMQFEGEIEYKVNYTYSPIFFNRDGNKLFSNNGVYDVHDKKMVTKWSFPKGANSIQSSFELAPGLLKSNQLLFQLPPYMPMIFDINTNKFHTVYNLVKGIDYNVKLADEKFKLNELELANYKFKISPNGEYIAGIILYSKNSKAISYEFKIWHLDGYVFSLLYAEILDFNLRAGSDNFEWNQDSRYLFFLKKNRLSRYKMALKGSISKVQIPISGFQDGQIDILDPSYIRIYRRIYDLETGKKLWPCGEVFDPFDPTNKLPLYDENPVTIIMRHY